MALVFQLDCAPDEAQAKLADPEFILQRAEALGELEATVEVEETEEAIIVTAHRKVVRDLPAVLARIFDAEQEMKVTETWSAYDDGSWGCEQVVEIVGQPVTVYGNIEINPTDGGSEYVVDQTAKARIPLVGGTVEKWILGDATKTVEAETEFLQQQLG